MSCSIGHVTVYSWMVSCYKIKLLWQSSRAGKWKSPNFFFMRLSRTCIHNRFCKKIGRDRFIPAWAAQMANYLVWDKTIQKPSFLHETLWFLNWLGRNNDQDIWCPTFPGCSSLTAKMEVVLYVAFWFVHSNLTGAEAESVCYSPIVSKVLKGNSKVCAVLWNAKSKGLVGRLSMCGLPGDRPHTSTQSYLHFIQEYQLFHLEGSLLPPLSSSVILVCPSDSMLVGHGLPLPSFHWLEQTW